MKLTICLALFAIASLVSCQTADESDFLVSHAWQVTSSVPANLTGIPCCMPGGLVSFIPNNYTDIIFFTATQWNGDLCADHNINPGILYFPFSNTSSFNDLVANGGETSSFNTEPLIFNVGNYSESSGVVSWSLNINFEATGSERGVCSVTLSTPDPTLENSTVSAQPTANDPNFLVNFWEVSATVPANLTDVDCCMPTVMVFMVPDSNGQITLTADQWNGTLCDDLGLNWKTEVTFPFSNTYSFNEIVGLVDQSAYLNGEKLLFSIGDYSDSDEVASWSFSINFEETSYAGSVCAVKLVQPVTMLA